MQVLTITPGERTALRDAHLASLRASGARVNGVEGPLPNSVYYALDHGTAGDEMLHDGAEHLRPERLPIRQVVLGDGHEVAAQEHPRHAGQREQRRRQRAACGEVGTGEIRRAGSHHD